jgi:DNA primase
MPSPQVQRPGKAPFVPYGKKGSGFNPKYAPKPIENDAAPRVLLATREDQILRLLLTDLSTLDSLTYEDRDLLGQLPAPHGELFHWLERQVNESGVLPWAALKQALPTGLAAAAERLMTHPLSAPASTHDSDSLHTELRSTLDRLLIERLKGQESATILAASTDPTALTHYRQLHQRRLELERQLASPSLD